MTILPRKHRFYVCSRCSAPVGCIRVYEERKAPVGCIRVYEERKAEK